MRRLALGSALVVVAAIGTWWLLAHTAAPPVAYPIPGEGTQAVSVEVLNGSGVDGLARQVTLLLRRQGIDVVYFGSADADTFTTTSVLLRRGDSTAATRVRTALGVGEVQAKPDERLLLDVTVILGRDAAALLHLDP